MAMKAAAASRPRSPPAMGARLEAREPAVGCHRRCLCRPSTLLLVRRYASSRARGKLLTAGRHCGVPGCPAGGTAHGCAAAESGVCRALLLTEAPQLDAPFCDLAEPPGPP